jgi:hypothetical protein
MKDDVPAPAGPSRPPWETALYQSVQKLEERVVVAERERDEAILRAHTLGARVAECRKRLETWELRRQAWGRERADLLRQIGVKE